MKAFFKPNTSSEYAASGVSAAAAFLQRCVSPAYSIMMACILLACLFCTGISYGGKNLCLSYPPAAVLLPIGLAALLILYWLLRRIPATGISTRRIYLLLSALLFLLQAYAVYNYAFETDWDVAGLVMLAERRSHGPAPEWFSNIYSRYPNNLFLGLVFSTIEYLCHRLHLHDYEYLALLLTQCALSAFTAFLLTEILDRLFGNRSCTAFGFLLYVLLVGISPWVSIPYSDSMGLVFPTFILYLYLMREKQPLLIWGVIGAAVYIGYSIKPQVAIILIAIALISLLRVLRNGVSRELWKPILGTSAGMLLAMIGVRLALRHLGVVVRPEETFHMQHFLMMGMNPQQKGVYSYEDMLFSASFETAAQRNAANLAVAMERIREMGPAGLFMQFLSKTLTNYNNGTFAWSGEGSLFFVTMREETGLPLCNFFRSLYYTGGWAEIGTRYAAWSTFEQGLWLTILLLGALSCFCRKCDDKDVVCLSVIGLSMFQAIFEARARYLFLYTPFYIILAVCGMHWLCEGLRKGKH